MFVLGAVCSSHTYVRCQNQKKRLQPWCSIFSCVLRRCERLRNFARPFLISGFVSRLGTTIESMPIASPEVRNLDEDVLERIRKSTSFSSPDRSEEHTS